MRRVDTAAAEVQVVGAVAAARSNGPIVAVAAAVVQHAVTVVQVTRRRIPGGFRRTYAERDATVCAVKGRFGKTSSFPNAILSSVRNPPTDRARIISGLL